MDQAFAAIVPRGLRPYYHIGNEGYQMKEADLQQWTKQLNQNKVS